jgi:hypothetical protein
MSPGSTGPDGLAVRIQIAPMPTEQHHTVFQWTCGGSFDTTFSAPTWGGYFYQGHQSEVPADDPCALTVATTCNTFDITGWQPGQGGAYAAKSYSQHLAHTCSNPGYSCYVTDAVESTILELRSAAS